MGGQEGFGSGAAMLRLVLFNGGVLGQVIKQDLVQKASPVQYKAYSQAKATQGRGGSRSVGGNAAPWSPPGEPPGLGSLQPCSGGLPTCLGAGMALPLQSPGFN